MFCIVYFIADLLGALPPSLSKLLAPFAHAVNSKLQTRLTCIVGVVISSVALAVTSLLNDAILLFLVYGFVFGCALSLITNPPYDLVNEYFPYNHPRHVLATSLVACANSLGKQCFNDDDQILTVKDQFIVMFCFYIIFSHLDLQPNRVLNNRCKGRSLRVRRLRHNFTHTWHSVFISLQTSTRH